MREESATSACSKTMEPVVYIQYSIFNIRYSIFDMQYRSVHNIVIACGIIQSLKGRKDPNLLHSIAYTSQRETNTVQEACEERQTSIPLDITEFGLLSSMQIISHVASM